MLASEFVKGTPWLVEGVVPRAGIAALYGEHVHDHLRPVALSLAMAVARGVPWLGRAVQQVPVFYVASRDSRRLKGDLLAHAGQLGVDLAEIPMHVEVRSTDLLRGDWERIACEARGHGAGLIVWDDFESSILADGSSEETVAEAMANLRALSAQVGAAVLLLDDKGCPDGTRPQVEVTVDFKARRARLKLPPHADSFAGRVVPFSVERMPLGEFDENGDELHGSIVTTQRQQVAA